MLNQLAQDCTAAADADIDFATVKGINLMFNDNLDGYAWGGSMALTLDGIYKSWRTTWEPPWAYSDISVIAHEMGHGFGFPHSSGSYGLVYDNAWDVMSKDRYNCATGAPADHPVYGCTAQHTIAYHKDLDGWIPSSAKLTLAASSPPTTVTLQPLSGVPTGYFTGLPSGHLLMAVIQTPDSGRWFTDRGPEALRLRRQAVRRRHRHPRGPAVRPRMATTFAGPRDRHRQQRHHRRRRRALGRRRDVHGHASLRRPSPSMPSTARGSV